MLVYIFSYSGNCLNHNYQNFRIIRIKAENKMLVYIFSYSVNCLNHNYQNFRIIRIKTEN